MRNIDHLIGKCAIVTGAAGGIGEYICVKLAEEYRMNLVITGRKRETLGALAEKLRGYGVKVAECIGDLNELDFIDDIIGAAAEMGGVDVLINNAGLSHNCPASEMTPELFDSIMRVNVRAPYFLSQKAVPYLKKSDCATIINICSVVAHKGYVNQSVYGASKHALLGFSKSMANELFKDNIRVHVVSPGAVYTDMIAVTRPDLTPEGMIVAEDIADIVGFYLEKRVSNAVIDEIEVHRATKEPFA